MRSHSQCFAENSTPFNCWLIPLPCFPSFFFPRRCARETGSDENAGVAGLGVVPSRITRFTVDASERLAVPQIGWNGINVRKASGMFGTKCDERFYFVHSFMALPTPENADWILATTNYGSCEFISAVMKGNVVATQFHPEKSGRAGLVRKPKKKRKKKKKKEK